MYEKIYSAEYCTTFILRWIIFVYYATKWIFQVIVRKRAAILKFARYSCIAGRMIVKTIFQIPWLQFYDSSGEHQCPVDPFIDWRLNILWEPVQRLFCAQTASRPLCLSMLRDSSVSTVAKSRDISSSISIYFIDLVFMTDKMAFVH